MKHSPVPGGKLEQAALAALWDLGSATAREIHGRVGEPNGLAYTTTATVLDRLHAKGFVARERVGKAFVYQARVKRQVVEQARAKRSVAWLLGREPRPAIATLVEAVEAVDPNLLDELARVVAARRKVRRGS
jgi:predicted transcriptional regulator